MAAPWEKYAPPPTPITPSVAPQIEEPGRIEAAPEIGQPAIPPGGEPENGAQRIANAAVAGWREPSLLTPGTSPSNQATWVGRNIVNPVVEAGQLPFRAVNALGAGLGQTAYEVGNVVDPRLGRDLYMLNQLAPAIVAGVPGGAAPVRQTFNPEAARTTAVGREIAQAPPPSALVTGVNDVSPEVRARAAERASASPEAPMEPSDIPPPVQQPTATVATPAQRITTAAGAKAVADAKYTQADQLGGTLTPQFTDRFLGNIAAAEKQTSAGRATTGPTELSQLLDRYTNGPDAISGQPLSLRAAQEIDAGLGDLIDKHFDRLTGLDKEGYRLMDVQRGLRDQIANAQQGDITGTADGFQALTEGRQAYAQYAKMRDLERMKARADGTQNPTSSFRTQVNNMNFRGYSSEEIAAVKDAADRGAIGGALHVMGSRLLPHVGGAVGAFVGGIPGFIAGELTTHVLGAGARNLANTMQTQRLNRALGVLGSRVPPNTLGPQP